MSASEEDAAPAAADGGSGGGSSGAGSSEGGARRRFDDKGLVARTSLILWHTHQNDVGAVRKLLEEDAALVNARDYDSRTPLHVAALHGWHDVAECLIANGADVNAQDRWQNTVGGSGMGQSSPTILPCTLHLRLICMLCLFRWSWARFGSVLHLVSVCFRAATIMRFQILLASVRIRFGLSNLESKRSATAITPCSAAFHPTIGWYSCHLLRWVVLSTFLHFRNLQIVLRIYGASCYVGLSNVAGATMIGSFHS